MYEAHCQEKKAQEKFMMLSHPQTRTGLSLRATWIHFENSPQTLAFSLPTQSVLRKN